MKVFWCFVIMVFAGPCFGQRETENWYFGSAGLNFSSGAPKPLLNSAMMSYEGAATISDAQGNLLFYTNGVAVWDSTHQMMKNGDGLSGDIFTTQGALILPVPGSAGQYYLFTSTAKKHILPTGKCENCAYYSIIDMDRNNGLGEVIVKNVYLSEAEYLSEKMAATLDCTGKGYWLLFHHEIENIFYAFNISSKGISSPVITRVGEKGENYRPFFFNYGPMKISPNGKKIVQANIGIELFDFDNRTGEVSRPLMLSNGYNYNVFHTVSFSPDSKKVYALTSKDNGSYRDLIQFDLDLPSTSAVVESRHTIAKIDFCTNSLQLAPDEKLYLSCALSKTIGVIEKPNALGDDSQFRSAAVFIGNKNSGNFPNFPDIYFHKGRRFLQCAPPIAGFISDTTICSGTTIQYTDTSDNLPNEWRWKFEGGLPSDYTGEIPPPIFYNEGGRFTTTLIVQNNFGSDTLIKTVLVRPRPFVDAGSDISVCPGSNAQLGTPAIAGNTYLWTPSAGLDNPNIAQPRVTPTAQATTYFLKVTNEFGCEAIDSVIVSIGEIKALVSDTSVCRGSSVLLKASGGSEYEWSPPDGLASTTDASVLASPLETTVYKLIAKSGECRDTAFLKVTVLDTPTADAGSDKEICFGESVQLGVAGENGLSYSWTPSEGLLKTDISNPIATVLKTTEYIVEVTNESGCTARDTVLVTVGDFLKVIASNDTSVCAGESVKLWAVSDEPGVTYKWSPETGLDDASIANPVAKPAETTTYTVTAFKNGGLCSAVDSVRIEVLKLPEVTTKDITLCEGETAELEVSSNEEIISWSWTPTTGLNNPNIQNPIVTAFKSQTYTVTATNESGCTVVKTLTVTATEKENITAVLKADKSELEPGESTTVKLLLKAENSAGITSFKALVHFDAQVFQFTENSQNFLNGADNTWFVNADITAPGELEITANGQTPIASSEIAFELMAYLAKQMSEDILLKLTEINGEVLKEEELCRMIETEGTKLVLKEVCAGDMRLVKVGEFQTALQQLTPNPVSGDNIEINYSVGLEGEIALEIYNSQGELVKTIFKGNQKTGVFKEMVSTEKFPSGVFLLKLSTQQATETRMFTIVK